MTPGRELDALIAETVMGWSKNKFREIKANPYGPACADFSTDMSATEELIKELHKQKKAVALHSVYHQTSEPFWSWICRIEWHDPNLVYQNTLGLGETISHAVCLAGLRAFGVTID